jgi:hypothetical protein
MMNPEKGAKLLGYSKDAYIAQMHDTSSEPFQLAVKLEVQAGLTFKEIKNLMGEAAKSDFQEMAAHLRDTIKKRSEHLGIRDGNHLGR